MTNKIQDRMPTVLKATLLVPNPSDEPDAKPASVPVPVDLTLYEPYTDKTKLPPPPYEPYKGM